MKTAARLMVVGGAVLAGTAAQSAGCAQSAVFDEGDGSGGAPSSSGGGQAGAGGAGGGTGGAAGAGAAVWPCGMDCATIETDACHEGVCNEESGKCAVVAAGDGAPCEDGLFCTLGDSCAAGLCKSGAQQNDCGLEPPICQVAQCVENSKTCTTTPAPQFTPCKSEDLCLVATYCQNGLCTGQKKDCTFAPVPDQCHVAVCDPKTGTCEPVPGNEGKDCTDKNDLCSVGNKCAAGVCTGGKPKDCSQLTKGCFNGVCDKQNGNCKQEPVPPGGKCNEAADDCNHGQCDDNGKCLPVPANENGPCKTDSCHSGESCKAGKCQGGGVIDQCVNKDGCCPPGCDQSNDDDCQSYVFLTSSNGIAGFYQYDIKKNSWSTVKSPPVVTHTQITNDGKYVYLMGDDNQVHRYDPVGASWQAAVPGPGNVVKSPIGFFQWFEPGFYYCKDGQNTMYVYRNNAWKSFSLGSSCSCAGSWDAAKKELYVRTYGQLGFQVVNTANDTVARTIADATNVGENSRSGSFYGGYFYSRTWDGPFQKFDGINGIKTDTGAKPAAGHTATDTDFKNAVIYVSGYGGQATVFQAFDTKTNTIKNAANQPAVDNHSTITVMR